MSYVNILLAFRVWRKISRLGKIDHISHFCPLSGQIFVVAEITFKVVVITS